MRWIVCAGMLAVAACATGAELGPEDNAPLPDDASATGNAPRDAGSASPPRGSSGSSGSSSSSGWVSGGNGGSGSSEQSGSSSSSGALVGTGATLDVPAGGTLRQVESCWDVGTGVETLALGAPLVLDFPLAWHVERLLDTAPQNVPGVQLGLGGASRARLLVPLGTPVEWFLGFASIVMQEGDDSANSRSCFFDVHAPGWQHARTSHWFDSGSPVVDKNLGNVSTTGGVVAEAYLEAEDYYRVELVPGAGDVAPVRTTIFDEYGFGAYVFQGLTPGPHSFDLRRVQPETLYHVHFTVTP